MKYIGSVILAFLTLFLSPLNISAQEKDCLILPGKGISKINLSFTSPDSIFKILGTVPIEEERYGKEDGGTQYVLKYPDKGIVVRMKKIKKSYEIISIQAQKPCECKTPLGIGIGSTKNELIEKMGKPNDFDETDKESHLTYKGVLFLLTKNKDNKFVVEKIQVIKE